jgi:hypothetical protein
MPNGTKVNFLTKNLVAQSLSERIVSRAHRCPPCNRHHTCSPAVLQYTSQQPALVPVTGTCTVRSIEYQVCAPCDERFKYITNLEWKSLPEDGQGSYCGSAPPVPLR